MANNKVPKPTYEINEGRFMRRLAHVRGNFQIPENDCWIWASTCYRRALNDGSVIETPVLPIMHPGTRGSHNAYARRWAWEHWHGEVPKGTVIVNVCGEPKCVRPHYLHNRPMDNGAWLRSSSIEAMTVQEKIDRATWLLARAENLKNQAQRLINLTTFQEEKSTKTAAEREAELLAIPPARVTRLGEDE